MMELISAMASAPSVPGFGADVPVGCLGGARGVGVDHDDLGAVLLGVLDDRPVMQVRADELQAQMTMYLEWM